TDRREPRRLGCVENDHVQVSFRMTGLAGAGERPTMVGRVQTYWLIGSFWGARPVHGRNALRRFWRRRVQEITPTLSPAVGLFPRSAVLGIVLAACLGPFGAGIVPAAKAARGPAPATSVLDWNAFAANLLVNVEKRFQPESYVYLAYTETAVYDAVVAISGQ